MNSLVPSSHFASFICEFDNVESFDIDLGQALAGLAELPDPRPEASFGA